MCFLTDRNEYEKEETERALEVQNWALEHAPVTSQIRFWTIAVALFTHLVTVIFRPSPPESVLWYCLYFLLRYLPASWCILTSLALLHEKSDSHGIRSLLGLRPIATADTIDSDSTETDDEIAAARYLYHEGGRLATLSVIFIMIQSWWLGLGFWEYASTICSFDSSHLPGYFRICLWVMKWTWYAIWTILVGATILEVGCVANEAWREDLGKAWKAMTGKDYAD